MAKQIIVTQNDYGIELETQFVDDKKKPLDITDYDVRVKVIYDGKTIDTVLAEHKDSVNGIAYIVLEKEHLINAGLHTTVWSVLDEDEHVTAQENVYYFVKDVEGSEDDTPTTDLPIDADGVLNKFNEIDNNLFELTEQGNVVNEEIDSINETLSVVNEQLDNIVLDVERIRIFGESDDGVLQRAITLIPNGGKILLSKEEYSLNNGLTIAPQNGYEDYAPNKKYKIYSNTKTVINYSGGGCFLQLGKSEWGTSNLSQGYIDVELENLRIRHLGTYSNSIGIDVLNVRKIKFKNIEVRGFQKGIHLLNVWNSSNMEEVIIWNADKTYGGIGLHIDRATNNITYKNCAVLGMDKGVLISGIDTLAPLGHIYTNLFTNLDVEFCKFGVLIDPQKCNVANIKFDTCHFENNDYHLVTYHTNTIWNLKIDTSYFMSGDINIATKTSLNEDDVTFGSSFVYGGGVINSFITNGKLRVNSANENNNIKNFDTKGCNFYGTYTDINETQQTSSLVTSPLSTNQSQSVMPRYSLQPITPTRADDIGDFGDIRWDFNNLYIRTQTCWKMIPMVKRMQMEQNEQIKITGKTLVPQKTIAGWGHNDHVFTVDGVDVDSGWVIKINPRKWLETGCNFNAWVSGLNTVTLRIYTSGNETTLLEQDWYYICERVSDN